MDSIDFENDYFVPLVVIFGLNAAKLLVQIVCVDGLSFILSLPNWVEILAYAFGFLNLFEDEPIAKSAYMSLGVLAAFINFAFLIQKLRVFGVYVMAFRRTLSNSAKFFPIFFLLWAGFLLAFRARVNSEVEHFNTTYSLTLMRGLTMTLGEIEVCIQLIVKSINNFRFKSIFKIYLNT